jgi:putative membrane protein
MWHGHDGMGWWMIFGGAWMVLFWGGVVWLIAWSITRLSRDGGPRNESAMDIAKRRYAKGEITKEQYDQLRHDLS